MNRSFDNLYAEAYRFACQAVKLDRFGQYDRAKASYGRVIEVGSCHCIVSATLNLSVLFYRLALYSISEIC